MRSGRNRTGARGFTLLEMMIVLTIIGILASIAVPMYQAVILRTREAVLKENLHSLRSVIDQYTADKKSAPQVLDDLVIAGYLREIPDDPITETNTSWQIELGDTALVPDQVDTGIVNVFSGSSGISSEGTPYSEW
jgi:general secretion pathway protein G